MKIIYYFKKKQDQRRLKKLTKITKRKPMYSVRMNLERIADNLLGIYGCLEAFTRKYKEESNKKGLSAICQNAYAANIRIEEIKELLKQIAEAGEKGSA